MSGYSMKMTMTEAFVVHFYVWYQQQRYAGNDALVSSWTNLCYFSLDVWVTNSCLPLILEADPKKFPLLKCDSNIPARQRLLPFSNARVTLKSVSNALDCQLPNSCEVKPEPRFEN